MCSQSDENLNSEELDSGEVNWISITYIFKIPLRMCSDFTLRREGWGEKRKEICRKSENFNVLNFSKDVSVQ